MYQPDGMPAYASLIDKEVDSQYQEDEQRMTVVRLRPARYGAACAPFTPAGAGGSRAT